MKMVIAGGSGTLGQGIAADFARRDAEVVVLTRSPRPNIPFRQVVWDGRSVGEWSSELDVSVLVNLAGELVDRPTKANIELSDVHESNPRVRWCRRPRKVVP